MTYEDDFLRVKGIKKTFSEVCPNAESDIIENKTFKDIYKDLDDGLKQFNASAKKNGLKGLFREAAQDIRASLDTEDNTDAIALQYAKEREKELELLPDVFSESSVLDKHTETIISISLNPQYRLDADYGDLTAHRPPSETENRFIDPLGSTRADERAAKQKTKGQLIKADDKTNDTDPMADIPLVKTFDRRDMMTGLTPFADNGARRRKKQPLKPHRFRGNGGGKPGRDMRDLSTRAVETDSIYSENLESYSGVPIEAEHRRFLLPKVLPMLTKKQREVLAKAFMAQDKEVIRNVLELVDQAYLDLLE